MPMSAINNKTLINKDNLQQWVFLLFLPAINLIFTTAFIYDIGVPIEDTVAYSAARLWLVFGLAYFVISFIEKHFSLVLRLDGFLQQLVLYIVVIGIISQQFALMIEFPSHLEIPKPSIGARIVIILEVSIYLVIVRSVNQQQRALGAEFALREAELNVLRSQSNPHFLFNTLNLIIAEISHNPNNAKEIVFDLSDLLRKSVKIAQQTETTVSEELKLVSLYLTLQQKRFKDRLTFEIRQDPLTTKLTIPSLLLQPIIENTVKHAIAPFSAKGHIAVTTSLSNDKLLITVTDTGQEFDDNQVNDGMGFKILRKTLDLHYPNSYSLELKSTDSGGKFSLSLPIKSEKFSQ
ncbi:sensor histidine kinase [Paraferrimonas sp. SM1919]|uniref:sensor histidine kinase n=1 Tax=Paraferrimonas sp. SM1919 TaxID=2662263 RepID=UPI0013D7C9B2|nr:histidine kinase [Paraferrimonas sp. SM1919]